ncbi:gephyrin-like molybdotransferase Glp [Anaeroselena agilis]|uniref:Molybdopterin molybdenumtransferase n=1 Tax=Anaeroselena agilis TaxID=3063788 RepID=A0ABU3NT70_9FIRM|nr:molybdopterin molybdotransferase MoeA [Selenomonadales bacterium 4137-cl]
MAVSLDMAQDKLLKTVQPLAAEEVALADCWRRVLAGEIVADTDFPPFDRSPLDGYALIAADVAEASPQQPVVLEVVDDIPAGNVPRVAVRPGTAAKIMTGAPVPEGATGVVRREDVREEEGRATVFAGAGVDNNLCRRGEEIAAGEKVITAGTVVNAGVMGLLALLGVARPRVYKQPRVALLATGSEVADIEAPLKPGAIRNSNSYMLAAQVRDAGAEPVLFGIARDEIAAIITRLSDAADCDLIVTTGGVSAGDYDLVADVYREMGIDVLFDRVGIKPGMPVLAGLKAGKLYIGLSGNPAAASVAFEQIVRPVLLKMGGRREWWRPRAKALLTAPFTKPSGATRFVWAACRPVNGGLTVEPLPLQGNGMLKSAVTANAMIVIPAGSPPLAAGSVVEVCLLADL